MLHNRSLIFFPYFMLIMEEKGGQGRSILEVYAASDQENSCGIIKLVAVAKEFSKRSVFSFMVFSGIKCMGGEMDERRSLRTVAFLL